MSFVKPVDADKYTASYIVYKKDSMYYAKACFTGGQDYSGTDAATVINNVLAILSTGGKILLKNATYPLSTGLVYYDNTIIEGESWATILYLNNAVNQSVIRGSGGYAGNRTGNNNIVIKNLQIDGNDSNQTFGYDVNGIDYSGLKNGLFKNLYIHDCAFSGLCDFGSHYVRVCENITLENSRITDSQIGIAFNFIKTLKVNNNYFENISFGCAIHGEASFVSDNIDDVTIIGNTIQNSVRGIEVGSLNASKGYGAYISGNYLRNLTISGITLYNIGQFYILGNTLNAVGSTVTSDPVDYYKRPIGMNVCTFGVIEGNTIANNDKTEDIYAYSCTRVSIIGNRLYTYTTTFDIIRLEGTAFCLISENWFQHGIGGLKAVVEVGASNTNIIKNNYSVGMGMTIVGASTIVKFNIGFTTETNGTGTVTAGNTYVTVTHGLLVTPDIDRIKLVPEGNLLGREIWVSDVGASTFRINMSAVDTINHVIGWSYGE